MESIIGSSVTPRIAEEWDNVWLWPTFGHSNSYDNMQHFWNKKLPLCVYMIISLILTSDKQSLLLNHLSVRNCMLKLLDADLNSCSSWYCLLFSGPCVLYIFQELLLPLVHAVVCSSCCQYVLLATHFTCKVIHAVTSKVTIYMMICKQSWNE